MDFKQYLETYNAQAKINQLAKRYKNKKIIIYGAGQFSREIFDNYDLSKLNIIAVADKKFTDEKNRSFYNLNCIPPEEMGKIDCDVILIANFDYDFFLAQLDDNFLYKTKNENVEIRPLIKLTFKDLF